MNDVPAASRSRPSAALRVAVALALLGVGFLLVGGCGSGGVTGGNSEPAFVGFRNLPQALRNPRGLPDSMYGSAAALLDWNADERLDFAVGFSGHRAGGVADAGAVHVYVQKPDGSFDAALELTATAWPGAAPSAGARLGAVLSTGDFDGDGWDDLAVGAPGESRGGAAGAGRVYVLLNSPLHTPRFPVPLNDPLGPEAEANYGAALASGDVTGDGADDLTVGAPGAQVSGRPRAGRLHVHVGRADFLLGSAVEGPLVDPQPEAGATLGSTVILSDVDGVGARELLVAAPGATLPFGPGGKVDVWSRHVGGLFERRATLADDAAGLEGQFGSSMVAADLDGDADDDLIVAVPGGDDAGVVAAGYAVVFECVEPSVFRFARRERYGDVQNTPHGEFATAVNVGDFDGDGGLDVVVGSPRARFGGLPGAGRMVVYLGATNRGTRPEPLVLTLDPVEPADQGAFGRWIEVGDFDRDGYDDMAVMAPGPLDGSAPRPGSAHVLLADVRVTNP